MSRGLLDPYIEEDVSIHRNSEFPFFSAKDGRVGCRSRLWLVRFSYRRLIIMRIYALVCSSGTSLKATDVTVNFKKLQRHLWFYKRADSFDKMSPTLTGGVELF